jgi:hypothetical protein
MVEQSFRWTWEKARERYQGFSTAADGLPEDILVDGDRACKTREAFLHGRGELFRPLRAEQPRTWKVLMEACAEPMVAQKVSYPERSEILTFNGKLPIFIEPFVFVDDHVEWDRYFAALPPFMHAYYSNFNGMHASFSTLTPSSLNLPAPVTRWKRLSNYQKERSIPKKDLVKIKEHVGNIDNIFIFVETDWDDLLLVNMDADDRKIYGIPQGKMAEYFELSNPAESLDKLFSHVLSGVEHPFLIKQNFS